MKRFGKKNKEKTPEPQMLPGGIDPTSPEARRINNPEEISFDDLKLYFLIIKINKGIDLKAADMTMKGGSSDPFCEVVANNQTFSTKTIMENLNPVWNEETTFCFFNLVNKIEFKVWDWDKGSKHDAIGNCFLNTSTFFDKNSNGFTGDITLENVKKGKVNVSVQGRLIVPKELEIRVDNLTKLKNEQINIINTKETELNKLKTENNNLTNKKDEKQNELNQLNNNKSNKNDEKDNIISENEKLQKDIDDEIQNIKNIDNETKDAIQKKEEYETSITETKAAIEKEEERKEEILEKMEDLRGNALGKFGKGLGKGLGMMKNKVPSVSVTQQHENKSRSSDDIPAKTESRRISQIPDPEIGHMNVGWIRANAPRQSLVDYQRSKIPGQGSISGVAGSTSQKE